jgi:stage V sporulation protein G
LKNRGITRVEITEVRIFLKDAKDKKLKAYAATTFDNVFVVRNIKIIEGNKGLFVAMPSRKLREACPACSYTNPVRAKFCNECGKPLNPDKVRVPEPMPGEDERQSDHRDIAHPITSEFRDYLQKKVLDAYEKEKAMVAK